MFAVHVEDTGRSKIRQTFWSFRGFRTKSIGLECPSRFSHGIPHDNVNVDKVGGDLQKRQYTQTILHFFIFCHF